MYPPVPVASRLLANDCEMDGCRIPKGMHCILSGILHLQPFNCVGAMVFIGIHTVHHDPLVWDDPKVNSLVMYMLRVICYIILSEI